MRVDFSKQLAQAISESGADAGEARKQARAIEVRNRYKEVIAAVYGTKADIFLKHTNAVFIMNKNDARTLIVYVDESIFSAELNAQRELIKLRFMDMFAERLDAFEIYVSRGAYKQHHPFSEEVPTEPDDHFVESQPLSAAEQKGVEERVSKIEDPRLAEALRKAMTTDLEWKKGISGGM